MRISPKLQKRFRKTVGQIGQRASWELLRIVGSPRGPQLKLSRKWRDKRIAELQDIVEKAYLPYLHRWVSQHTHRVGVRFNNHFAKEAKASEVRYRLTERMGNHQHLAYVSFAGRDRCLKVGRSDNGYGRIVSQQDAYYFRDASRVEVYFPKYRKKSMLPALECALTHLYDPYHYYQKPAARKYRQTCPACHAMKVVRKVARALYPA
ncbi:MAG TPA: hypothetical protein VGR39_02575 [Candidatus Acidoferrales bacterium]|nr:hypothetical protein [Candidatus Acidoferrales bacterium]